MSATSLTFPRLTETLPHRAADRCNRCGYGLPGPHNLQVWQEHDDGDRPELRYVLLCKPCADKVIERHPRLYRLADRNEPCPGVMGQCEECIHRDGLVCRCPEMKANGGPGVAFLPADDWARYQMAGPGGRGRKCKTVRIWSEVPPCSARVEKKGGGEK